MSRGNRAVGLFISMYKFILPPDIRQTNFTIKRTYSPFLARVFQNSSDK